MKIVVVGGTGLIGSRLVNQLRERGHEAVPASPSKGVDIITGQGLAAALAGASIMVDVTNAPAWEDAAVMNFFTTSTRNLLEYGSAAGVKHFVALSVVGTERMLASGYFRAKLAQEDLIKAGPIPYTIVRATQFFEFVKSIGDFSTRDGKVRLPAAPFQPMAAEDVASQLADIALEPPWKSTIDIAGPEKVGLDELIRRDLAARQDPREVVTDPAAGYFGVPVDDKSLVPLGAARLGSTTFKDWLKYV